jgi:3-dehydroquinate synthase
MRRIEVRLGERSYPIHLADGLLANAGPLLEPFARGNRLIVVSDAAVWGLYGPALGNSGIELVPIILPEGEGAKSWDVLTGLAQRLLELGVERSDHIVALGGGAIGDVTGFAAAIVKRGCFYIQIPTTLLAQVDSSVGGKTAINAAAGKNMVGAFHQPSAVLIDPATLDTLSEREVRAGYAEVVKYGLLGDSDFFAWCEANAGALLAGDPDARLHAIETSVRAKAEIVGQDERETSGRRALLNLGHTFGHAIEAETGIGGKLLHGEAVALGMALAFRFSAAQGLCSGADAERVEAHLRETGLPVRLSEVGITDGAGLVPHMLQDKKREQGKLPFILVRGIGEAFLDRTVKLEDIRGFLASEH